MTRLAVAFLLALSLHPQPAAALLLSESGDFGADTITHDTATGLRWLDLTESTSLGYAQLLGQLDGGTFAGYRLATSAEVVTLWEHAGIDTSGNDFRIVNYDPIVALAGLLGGPLASNGNCGDGCTFFFLQGWTANADPPPAFLTAAALSWFDNSAPLSPSYPQAPIGRAHLSQTSDGSSAHRGAWLVELPEPTRAALGAAAALALGVSRSERSAHRPPRARRR